MFFSKQFLFGLHFVLLFHSTMALSVDSNCRNQEEELAQVKATLTACQRSLLVASKRNSEDQQPGFLCPSCGGSTMQLDELEETTDVGIEFVRARSERNLWTPVEG